MLSVRHSLAGLAKRGSTSPHLIKKVIHAMLADKWPVRIVFAAEEVHHVVNRPWPDLLPLAALARVWAAADVLPLIVDAGVRGLAGRQDRRWRWSSANGSRGSE
jgi:hypothetical protein